MGLIRNHFVSDVFSKNANTDLIAKLRKAHEKKELSFEDWVDSGRYLTREHFEKDNYNELLHTDCTDVVMYMGRIYVQALKSGKFYINNTLYDTLEHAEKALWDKHSEHFF
jgi:hypothetical protein